MKSPFRSPKCISSSLWKVLAFAVCGAAIAFAVPRTQAAVQRSDAADTLDTGLSMTIEGLVRDVACPMQNHRSTATRFNLSCARACIQNGSPLVILTKTDAIYFPMTGQMPDRDARAQLIPYAGKFVRVTGTVFRRNGTRTIVVQNIRELKDVKLDINLGDD